MRAEPGPDSCLLCFDNYREVGDGIVDLLIVLSDRIQGSGAKMAVAMRGDTPAYDRFYQRADVKEGRVKEIQLGRFDVATARQFLGADLDQEAFQLVYMLTRGQPLALFLPGRKCGIEYLRIKALLTQMRADVQDPQRRIGLHDLKLLGIFVKKIAVSEKDVHKGG